MLRYRTIPLRGGGSETCQYGVQLRLLLMYDEGADDVVKKIMDCDTNFCWFSIEDRLYSI